MKTASVLCLALFALQVHAAVGRILEVYDNDEVMGVFDICGPPAMTSSPSTVTGLLPGVARAYDNNGVNMKNAESRYEEMVSMLRPIGCHQEMIASASDAMGRPELIADGMSGDVDFPFCDMVPLLTIGEYDAQSGYVPPGPPDGQGVYALDDHTLRFIVQAESYGHIPRESPTWYYTVNGGNATFTGSHVSFIDYDRSKMRAMMERGVHSPEISSVAGMVKGAGSMIENVINLAGKPVMSDEFNSSPHYGDCAADGTYVTSSARTNVWTMHSLCSAHLAQAHQWGEGLGVEDDIFLTNEEWTVVNEARVASNGFVGLSSHAIDMSTRTAYAVGAWGMGGFEKVVEFNCGSVGYVCFAVSGYNGNFGHHARGAFVERRRRAVSAARSDGTAWRYPENIVPSRVYIGVKGMTAGGSRCEGHAGGCGFLERNGLAHGRVYGFAVPSDARERDSWHARHDRADAEPVAGVFAPTAWAWDGVVRDFEHDIAWEFQEAPATHPATHKFWTGAGRDRAGMKTEHVSPDPRGGHRFLQGSTAGYMGIYSMPGLGGLLSGGLLPESIPASYELLEGEVAVDERIELGGKGLTADGGDHTTMTDGSGSRKPKSTFEDIDGLEWVAAAGGRDFVVVFEDGGNVFGERMVMCELPPPGERPTYFFLAMGIGEADSRSEAGVCIPAGTASGPGKSEFSGGSDMSGALRQEALGGRARRAADAKVAINDKLLAISLQARSCDSGVLAAFGLDHGGQVYALQPRLPDQTSHKQ